MTEHELTPGSHSPIDDERPDMTGGESIHCTRNKCGEAPEIADAFGHDRHGHAMVNLLVRNGIRSPRRLREMSDEQILDIRGISLDAIPYIRRHFPLIGPGTPGDP